MYVAERFWEATYIHAYCGTRSTDDNEVLEGNASRREIY